MKGCTEVICQEMIFQLSGDYARIIEWCCEFVLLILTKYHLFNFIGIKLLIVIVTICIIDLHVLFKVFQSINFSSLVLIIRVKKKRLGKAGPLSLFKNLIRMTHHMSMIVKSSFWRYFKRWTHVLLICLYFFLVDYFELIENWLQFANYFLIDCCFFVLFVVYLSLLLSFVLILNQLINIFLRLLNFFELIDRVGNFLL